ncbi:hypothetical protein ACWDA9_39750, partial [Streptomyces sp. NPDC001193]
DLDPWHPNVVRAGAGLHYATTVDRVDLAPRGRRPFAYPDTAVRGGGHRPGRSPVTAEWRSCDTRGHGHDVGRRA